MTSEKFHIAILCSRLDLPGGIERAVVNAANLFAENGHPVSLIILDENDKSFYPVHSSIKIIQQQLSFGITTDGNIISRKVIWATDILKLKKILKKCNPAIVISTEYPFTVAAVLAGAKNYSRLYSWEHHHYAWLKINKFWTFLCKQAYPKLNGVICLNKTEEDHYKNIAPSFIIPNYAENKSGEKSKYSGKKILSVGWLIPRKGIDLMLQTAKIVLRNHPDWQWKLIGEGEMKNQVLKFINDEKLEGRFILQAPLNEDIRKEYLNASIYVMTSRFEAFPMVLLEAMSFGVPCISFDCPSGPSDIISNNIDGILVEKENPQKLAEAISILIEDDLQRKKMGEAAFKKIQQFSADTIYKIWKEKIFT